MAASSLPRLSPKQSANWLALEASFVSGVVGCRCGAPPRAYPRGRSRLALHAHNRLYWNRFHE
jgi:hypothetical protein